MILNRITHLNRIVSLNSSGMGGLPIPYTMLDASADAFVTAANITNDTQREAIDLLVIDLKAASLWTLMGVVYPFVGGNSESHRFNLKNPSLYKITYATTVGELPQPIEHTSTGVKFKQVPASQFGHGTMADTGCAPSAVASSTSHHISYYSRTQMNGNEYTDMGCASSASDILNMRILYTSGATHTRYFDSMNSSTGRLTVSSSSGATTIGLWTLSRTSTSSAVLYNNATSVGSIATTGGSIPTSNMFIGGLNNIYSPFYIQVSERECAWASMGSGLSAGQQASLNTIVQNYQTRLSRNV